METKLDTELALVKGHVDDFLNQTQDARALSERDRDYVNHKQWSDAEIAKLNSRNQAPVINNHVKPKVEGLKGLLVQRKTDPKAYPRTEKHAKAAEAITDALRYVDQNVDMDGIELDVADNFFVEGYGAAITEIEEKKSGFEVTQKLIPWDRYYYDPYSRRVDFSDKRFDGVVIWMDKQDAIETFDIKEADQESMIPLGGFVSSLMETFSDRPNSWTDKDRERVRVCQHYYLKKGVWTVCYFMHDRFLIEPEPSQYLDEDDNPINPIEAVSAYIDRENNRFGEVRYFIDLQDEINHRRSKYLFMLSNRQTMGRKGAVDDIKAMKREMSKPNGHVEYKGEKGDFDVMGTGDMADAQFRLLQDSINEMGSKSFSQSLAGSSSGDLSGKAEQIRQQAATTELASSYAHLSGWKKRTYRQFWLRIRQYWDKEKWIRILDDQSQLRWVGLNTPVTIQEALEEKINDESELLPVRKQAAAMFAQMMQDEDPKLQEIIEVRNEIAGLDLDIIIDQSVDSITAQAEEFNILANVAQTRPEIPFSALLKLSNVRQKTKDEIMKDIEAGQKSQGEQQQAAAQKDDAKTEAKMMVDGSKAKKNLADTQLTEVQTRLLMENPPEDASVII